MSLWQIDVRDKKPGVRLIDDSEFILGMHRSLQNFVGIRDNLDVVRARRVGYCNRPPILIIPLSIIVGVGLDRFDVNPAGNALLRNGYPVNSVTAASRDSHPASARQRPPNIATIKHAISRRNC
jgi:hypothetical protein